MNRSAFIERIFSSPEGFDLAIIGGGANGAGIALDAASRGLSVVLLERGDFGCGTSSRSSKLIHGGVRYLALGQLGLVREALAERTLLLENASAIVKPQPFLIPAYGRLELLKFGAGLKFYDWLAGAARVRTSRSLDSAQASSLAPGLVTDGMVGAACYYDAQFDDARLLISILKRAAKLSAIVVNYLEVTELSKDQRGKVRGVVAVDEMSGNTVEVAARCVINATGAQGDDIRRLDNHRSPSRVMPSQGAHIVVHRRFLGGDHAVVLPHTPDGRIMFAIPWAEHLLLGTTDTPLTEVSRSPVPFESEIAMILKVAGRFLDPAPSSTDILSSFAGVRPLVATPGAGSTAKLSREHAIDISTSGLVSVSGGKWTTYRLVAEQCVDEAVRSARLAAGRSASHALDIARADGEVAGRFSAYGAEQRDLEKLIAGHPELDEPLHPDLPYCGAHFVWAAKAEMALTVYDALAYRTRAMFINARAGSAIARRVAELMATELGHDRSWIESQTNAVRTQAIPFTSTPTRAHETHG